VDGADDSRTIAEASEPGRGPGSATVPSDALVGTVESALAEALSQASREGRWELVAQLAGELEARRRAREGQPSASVVDLDAFARRA
jgi:hypothetical protein